VFPPEFDRTLFFPASQCITFSLRTIPTPVRDFQTFLSTPPRPGVAPFLGMDLRRTPPFEEPTFSRVKQSTPFSFPSIFLCERTVVPDPPLKFFFICSVPYIDKYRGLYSQGPTYHPDFPFTWIPSGNIFSFLLLRCCGLVGLIFAMVVELPTRAAIYYDSSGPFPSSTSGYAGSLLAGGRNSAAELTSMGISFGYLPGGLLPPPSPYPVRCSFFVLPPSPYVIIGSAPFSLATINNKTLPWYPPPL